MAGATWGSVGGTASDEGGGVGYLHIMCLIGFFSEHACMSQGKKCVANL